MVHEDEPGGELNDSVLKGEIELLGELIEVVAQADHRLCESEIDQALQIDAAQEGGDRRPVRLPEAG